MKPLISVIVPVYNAVKYLTECIQSVLQQTYQNFELILIDDGSTDSSAILCDKWRDKDNRIKVYHKANGKQLQTRIFGISKSNGQYLVFLDSDDFLEREALEIIVDKFNRFSCDCVIYGYQIVQNGKIIGVSDDERDGQYFETDKRQIWKKMLVGGYHAMWRKATKKDVFKGYDFSPYYDITRGEDLIHSLEVYKNSNSCVFISNKLYNYRMNSLSVTHNRQDIGELKGDFRGRILTLQFLKEENVFLDEDYETYRLQCVRQFIGYLELIARADGSKKEKINLYKKIGKVEYVSSFLYKDVFPNVKLGIGRIFFKLYRKKKYRRLMFLFRLKGVIKKLT